MQIALILSKSTMNDELDYDQRNRMLTVSSAGISPMYSYSNGNQFCKESVHGKAETELN